jgi:short subunit dehydrogenase-like uncharacterized protein
MRAPEPATQADRCARAPVLDIAPIPLPSTKQLVIYGAYGVTGRLLVEEAARRGHRPILAGRSLAKLGPVAAAHGLEAIAVALDDRDELDRLVARARLVIHAAGPFVETSEPMIRACLAQRAHYVDTTGELPVISATFAHDRRAREAGVVLMSAAGFDVVPSDCLALHVARRIEKPSRLRIAIATSSSPSAGTVKSLLSLLPRGGVVRRHGELVAGPLLAPAIEVGFGDRTRSALPVPLGDLESAWRSTGIAEIETFYAPPPALIPAIRWTLPVVRAAIARPGWRARIFRAIDGRANGPGEQERDIARSHVWACAENARGERAESWLEGPETYGWTARLVWDCADRICEPGTSRAGAFSPAQLFGADFVLGEGISRGDR